MNKPLGAQESVPTMLRQASTGTALPPAAHYALLLHSARSGAFVVLDGSGMARVVLDDQEDIARDRELRTIWEGHAFLVRSAATLGYFVPETIGGITRRLKISGLGRAIYAELHATLRPPRDQDPIKKKPNRTGNVVVQPWMKPVTDALEDAGGVGLTKDELREIPGFPVRSLHRALAMLNARGFRVRIQQHDQRVVHMP